MYLHAAECPPPQKAESAETPLTTTTEETTPFAVIWKDNEELMLY